MQMKSDTQNLSNKILDINQETELEKKLLDLNLTLEEYLNHPDAIQCFKDMKENAQKYFDRNKIKELIKYIIEEPKEDEYNKGQKYPFIACEMLTNSNKRIQEMIIFTEEDFNNKYKDEIVIEKEIK